MRKLVLNTFPFGMPAVFGPIKASCLVCLVVLSIACQNLSPVPSTPSEQTTATGDVSAAMAPAVSATIRTATETATATGSRQNIPIPTATAAVSKAPPTVQANPAGTFSVPILMYHYVGELPPNPDQIRKGLTVSQQNFDAQMRFLVRRGYQTVSLGDLVMALKGRSQLPLKPIVLTFDDGYDDNFRVAFPILKQNNFRGTFFIITDFVGRQGYMNWDQLRELGAAGMDLGSHTKTHPDLATASSKVVVDQVKSSKEALERELKTEIKYFCYPSGKYNSTVVSILQENGYQAAVTTKSGTARTGQSPLELPRLRISGDTSIASFQAILGEK